MAVCQLGVLWAGHHFVPLAIDAASISLQARGLLEAGPISLVLCAPSLVDALEAVARRCAHRVSVRAVDDSVQAFRGGGGDGVEGLPTASAAEAWGSARRSGRRRFCTFHTSGTTGTPKAVHSSYAEFAAFATAAAPPYRLTRDSAVLVATSHVFDPSAGMTFAAWAAGAAVCLVPWKYLLQHLRQSVELTCATHACSTPSVWALYDDGAIADADAAPAAAATPAAAPPAADDDADVAAPGFVLLLGGEPMPVGLIRSWLGRGACVINTYGTTEATVYQFAYALPPEVARLADDEVREHALCLGEPFDGIGASLLLEGGEQRGVSAADGAGLPLAEEGSRGELVRFGACRWAGGSAGAARATLLRTPTAPATSCGGATAAGSPSWVAPISRSNSTGGGSSWARSRPPSRG